MRHIQDRLLKKIHDDPDFPAFSQHVREINQLASEADSRSANELANVILRDYALTQKLLKLINTPSYFQFSGQVHTVTRAVVILGFSRVRAAALSILLFEHFQERGNSDETLGQMLCSLFGGLISRELMQQLDSERAEEAFLAGLLHDLGRLLVIYYLPEDHARIRQRTEETQRDEEAVALDELGMSYATLGYHISEEWGFPREIARILKPSNERQLDERALLLKRISRMANMLAGEMALQDGPKDLQSLLADQAKHIGVESESLEEALDLAQKDIETYIRLIPMQASARQLIMRLTQPPSARQVEEMVAEAAALEADYAAEQERRRQILRQGMNEISEALMGPYELGDLLVGMLETLYVGLGMQRVLLFLHNPRQQQLVPRLGFGEDVETLIEQLRVNLNLPSLFSEALQEKRDMALDDLRDHSHLLPVWHLQQLSSRYCGFFPLIVQGRSLGLLYLDSADKGPLEEGALTAIKNLRNQAALAIFTNSRL